MTKHREWICGKFLVAEKEDSSPPCPNCDSDDTITIIGANNSDFWISCGDCSKLTRRNSA